MNQRIISNKVDIANDNLSKPTTPVFSSSISHPVSILPDFPRSRSRSRLHTLLLACLRLAISCHMPETDSHCSQLLGYSVV